MYIYENSLFFLQFLTPFEHTMTFKLL